MRRRHASEVDGMVHYDVDSFPGYGRMSHNPMDQLAAGHRIEGADPRKRNHYDFTLWRAGGSRRLMRWPSPWGDGYPGWHIECSAMRLRDLGESFDVHTGRGVRFFHRHQGEMS